jgi:D-hexose-6-phosphate mutarotase
MGQNRVCEGPRLLPIGPCVFEEALLQHPVTIWEACDFHTGDVTIKVSLRDRNWTRSTEVPPTAGLSTVAWHRRPWLEGLVKLEIGPDPHYYSRPE